MSNVQSSDAFLTDRVGAATARMFPRTVQGLGLGLGLEMRELVGKDQADGLDPPLIHR